MVVSWVVAILMVLCNLSVPHHLRILGVALLLVPQFYLPGLPASLAVLWTLTTCCLGFAARGRTRSKSPLVLIGCLFLMATAVSLLWALPSGMYFGVVNVVFGVVFVLWLREVLVVSQDDPRSLDAFMAWAAPGIVLQSVLCIVFRLSPAIEERFLRSSLASFTIGPSVNNLYSDLPNNVLDPSKAGGLFVNGNVASLFCSVAALLLCLSARRTGSSWLYASAALALTGSISTGSKTAVFILLAVSILFVGLPYLLNGPSIVAGFPIVLALLYAPPLLGYLGQLIAPTFLAESRSSIGTRQRLWSRATEIIQDSPIFGAGFGGWGESVGKIGSRYDLPPHNFVIAAWVYSGIFAAILAIGFVISAVALGLRVVSAQTGVRDRRTASLAFCAVFWVFVHGLGDNTGFYGDRSTMILFAVAVGYMYAMTPGGRSDSGDAVDNAVRAPFVSRQSAISAVRASGKRTSIGSGIARW